MTSGPRRRGDTGDIPARPRPPRPGHRGAGWWANLGAGDSRNTAPASSVVAPRSTPRPPFGPSTRTGSSPPGGGISGCSRPLAGQRLSVGPSGPNTDGLYHICSGKNHQRPTIAGDRSTFFTARGLTGGGRAHRLAARSCLGRTWHRTRCLGALPPPAAPRRRKSCE